MQRWLRFVVVGVANTGLTYAVYLALHRFIGYQPAFAVAYVLGILFAYWANATTVFRVGMSWRTFSRYPLVYLVQYLLGALLLELLVRWMGVAQQWAALVVAAALVPVSYLANKWVLRAAPTVP